LNSTAQLSLTELDQFLSLTRNWGQAVPNSNFQWARETGLAP